MTNQTSVIAVVNDLLRINHDRIDGYEKAIKETKPTDADLRTLFTKMIGESQKNAEELTSEVTKLGGTPAHDTTQSGKVYRAWMDVKAAFSGNDRKAILSSCEFGEDAAQKAYDMALNSDVQLPSEVYQLVSNEKSTLKTSHDEIKRLRDALKN